MDAASAACPQLPHTKDSSPPHPPLSTGKVVAENVASWRPYTAFKVQLSGAGLFS